MITFDNVTKLYKTSTRPALNEISLTIDKGDFVFLIGPSGSGKSTFLELMIRETNVTYGDIHIDDFHVNKLKGRQINKLRQKIGYVFQDFRLLQQKTVYDNVAFALEVIGTRKDKIARIVPNTLELVDLAGKENRYPHELSGGEQQRVALARALAAEPKLLLLDEPFSSLHTGLRGSLRNLTRAQAGRLNIPAVLVTHDPEEAFLMADRIALMADGRIIQEGSPDELGAHPNSAAAAKLLGCRNVSDTFYLPPDALFPDPAGSACPVLALHRLPGGTRAEIGHPQFGRIEMPLPPGFHGCEIRVGTDTARLVRFQTPTDKPA